MRALSDMRPLALHLVFQSGSGAGHVGTVAAWIEHSGDGLHFVRKNAVAEIPATTVGALSISLTGAEPMGVAGSHGFVRIAMNLTATLGAIGGQLDVYAAGQGRVNRAHHARNPRYAPLPDAIGRHLSPELAGTVARFRAKAGMSPESLGEIRRLYKEGGGVGEDSTSDARERAEHAGFFLSLRARRELVAFNRERITSTMTVLAACCARYAVISSKLRVKAEPVSAQGTSSTMTPHLTQSTRRSR
ncbi:MAG TPA: hypothetical protein VHB21_08405 [Minicystis sp.]|nr:hypothetical protein [Minicystis sp.]